LSKQPEITIFVEHGRILGKLAKMLTAPLVIFSALSLVNLYFKSQGDEKTDWAVYITNYLALLSTFMQILTVSYALGVVTFIIFLARKKFSVNTRDIIFLFTLTLPPITFLFVKNI
jgi:hypothetical protein